MNLAALLLLLGLAIPSGLPAGAVAVIQSEPIRVGVDYVVNGSACSPRWGQPCDRDTATITFDGDLGRLACVAYHEALHLTYGPDTAADPENGDAWWQEDRVYRETREVVGPECP